nr:MhqN4 [uncultured bacterium]
MDLFEAIRLRRSVRRFRPDPFPDEFISKALEAAILAPNSSNTQTWDFIWIKGPKIKAKVVHACFSQSAARTASQLVVVTANPKNWKRSQKPLVKWVRELNVHKKIILYYEKIVPFTYRSGVFNVLAPPKWLATFLAGIFRPVTRGPFTWRGLQEVAVKSAALASENFVLAITAQGGATCMMEGFDEWRLKRYLKLRYSTQIVMVIGVGYESERGTWGPQFRLPLNEVVHVIED